MNIKRVRFSAPIAVLVLVLVGGCAGLQTARREVLSQRLDGILNRLDHTGATVAVRVLELPSRSELYARNIDTPFTPASNMKLPISATGLDMFGADHTFKTYFALEGDDLWIVGGGDPGLGDPRLADRRGRLPTSVLDDWADALIEHGVTRITGNLYYYDGVLDDQWRHPSWVEEDLLHWYAAPITGLNFNDNCVDITIFPTEVGRPVRFEVMPPTGNITVINGCITADEHAPTIAKLPDENTYEIGGTCAKSEQLKSKPVENPGAFTAAALRTHLLSRGIAIDGETLWAAGPLGGTIPPPPETILAVHETPLRDILGRINTNSQNLFAEALCKLTGRAFAAREGRDVPGSWAEGERAIRDFLGRSGIDDRQFVLADGSGLSEDNKVTARLISDLLAVMFDRPDADVFRDSLAKGGVDGTLKKRFPSMGGRVFAKTGYISGVRALSGYVRSDRGEWLAFSIIYNNIPGSVKPYEKLQDEAVRLLSHWPNLPAEQAVTETGRASSTLRSNTDQTIERPPSTGIIAPVR